MTALAACPHGVATEGCGESLVPPDGTIACVCGIECDPPRGVERGQLLDEIAVLPPAVRDRAGLDRVAGYEPLLHPLDEGA